MKKLFVTTLGCKVNQFESASFKAGLEETGYQLVSRKQEADLVIINTCAVTAGAGAQSRQIIRQCLRRNPSARIIITGCYAEIDVEKIASIDELEDRNYCIVGNSEKDTIVSIGSNPELKVQQLMLGEIDKAKNICHLPVKRFDERSRAYLRIQDGCESFCTYCIVPYTRGPSRSLEPSKVLEQASVFAQEGHREIVLTGIHLGNYGKDLEPSSDIINLLDRLSTSTPQVSYRISSLEPLEITVPLLTLMKQRTNIQPHLHIPLQSGHNDILKQMNRRYSVDQFREVIDLCHDNLPNLSIGIDILAGFPGETDEQFQQAKLFLQTLDFSYLHVFPYSRRPGTIAADLPNQVPKEVKDQRVAELLALSTEKQLLFNQSQIGQVRQVLIEGRRDKEGRLKGFSDNYIDTRFEGPDRLLGGNCRVKLLSVDNNIVTGEIHEHNED